MKNTHTQQLSFRFKMMLKVTRMLKSVHTLETIRHKIDVKINLKLSNIIDYTENMAVMQVSENKKFSDM